MDMDGHGVFQYIYICILGDGLVPPAAPAPDLAPLLSPGRTRIWRRRRWAAARTVPGRPGVVEDGARFCCEWLGFVACSKCFCFFISPVGGS